MHTASVYSQPALDRFYSLGSYSRIYMKAAMSEWYQAYCVSSFMHTVHDGGDASSQPQGHAAVLGRSALL